jgi:hypothetical protein
MLTATFFNCYAECHFALRMFLLLCYAECRCAKCRYGYCRGSIRLTLELFQHESMLSS